MTLKDVQACIDHIARFEISATTKEQYKAMAKGLTSWIAPGGQDLEFLTENRIGRVIRRNG